MVKSCKKYIITNNWTNVKFKKWIQIWKYLDGCIFWMWNMSDGKCKTAISQTVKKYRIFWKCIELNQSGRQTIRSDHDSEIIWWMVERSQVIELCNNGVGVQTLIFAFACLSTSKIKYCKF